MKKLHLDGLKVDSFATTPAVEKARGTVAGQEMMKTLSNCPESWDGTCWMSCWVTCTCDTDFC